MLASCRITICIRRKCVLPEGRRRPLLLSACAQASPSTRSVCQYSVWTFSILKADMKDVDLAAAVIVCVANWLSIKCTQHSYVSVYSAAYLERIRLVCRTKISCQCKIWGFYVGIVEDSGLLACDCAIFVDQVSNSV